MRQFPFRTRSTREPWTMERCLVRQSGAVLHAGTALKPVKFRTEQRRSISARKQRYVLTLITPFDPFSFHRDISGYQQLGIHCQRALSRPALTLASRSCNRNAFHNVSVNETIPLSFIPLRVIPRR